MYSAPKYIYGIIILAVIAVIRIYSYLDSESLTYCTGRVYSHPVEQKSSQSIQVNGCRLYISKKIDINIGDLVYSYSKKPEINKIFFYPKIFIVKPNKAVSTFLNKVFILRAAIIRNLKSQIGDIYADMLLGILIGYRNININIADITIKSGVSHIYVASGFNITVMALALEYLLNRFRFKLAILLAVFLYVLLVGIEPPILRAFIMFAITYIYHLKGANYSQYHILYLSMVISLIIFPFYINSLSFVLSCLATFAIITSSRYITIKHEFIKIILSGIVVSLCIAPLILVVFKTYNLSSILSSVLITYSIPVLFILTIFLLITNIGIINSLIIFICKYILAVTYIGSESEAVMTIEEVDYKYLLYYYIVLLVGYSILVRVSNWCSREESNLRHQV